MGSTAFNHLPIEKGAVLERTRLRLKVDVNESKSFGIAESPLKIVQKRPGKVPLQGGPCFDGLMRGDEMAPEIIDSALIGDPTFGIGSIIKGRPIFSDVERNLPVPRRHPEETARESLREDFPAHVGGFLERGFDSVGSKRCAEGGIPDDGTTVVIDAEKVDGRLNQPKVLFSKSLGRSPPDLFQFLGIAAEKKGIQELSIHPGIGAARSRQIQCAVTGWILGLQVDHDPDFTLGFRPESLNGQPMGSQDIVGRLSGQPDIRQPRRVRTGHKPLVDHDPGLVEGGPVLDPPAEVLKDLGGIVGKPGRRISLQPSAPLTQGQGVVPVVKRHVGDDASAFKGIQQALIKVEARNVQGSPPVRKNSGPIQAEAVGLKTNRLHQPDIVGIASVVVTGHIPMIVIDHASRLMTEGLPVRGAGAIGKGRAFDLKGRGRGAPDKIRWKQGGGHRSFSANGGGGHYYEEPCRGEVTRDGILLSLLQILLGALR